MKQASDDVTTRCGGIPLYMGYDKDIRAKIADITNAPAGGMAGAITAALFLKRFVSNAKSWAHFDIYGWAPTERAHSPGWRRGAGDPRALSPYPPRLTAIIKILFTLGGGRFCRLLPAGVLSRKIER